jgi:hypothetical protein
LQHLKTRHKYSRLVFSFVKSSKILCDTVKVYQSTPDSVVWSKRVHVYQYAMPGECEMKMRDVFLKGRPLEGWKLFKKNDSGVAAIEFAFLGPTFLLLLGVVLETGLMLFTEYVIQTSVQDAARLVRTGQAQSANLSVADFKQKVCKLAGIMVNCNNITVWMKPASNFDSLRSDFPDYLNIGPQFSITDPTPVPPVYDCGDPGEVVGLIATYDYNFKIPFFMSYYSNRNNGKTRRIAGFAMFKNEPFPPPPGVTC